MVAENPVSPVLHQEIPLALVYEVLNGRPLYYRGYKEVLSGTSTLESVMGSSDSQGAIVSLSNAVVWNGIDRKRSGLYQTRQDYNLAKVIMYPLILVFSRRAWCLY